MASDPSPSRTPPARPSFVRLWLVPGLIGVVTLVAIALGENAYHLWTGEDRVAEWLQVVFFVGALVEAVRAQRALARAGRRGTASLYLVAVAGLVFLVGEEISWGQRIFGWSTPEGLAAMNRQGETTVHNIGFGQDLVAWALLAIGLWGSVLPRLLRPGAWLAGRRAAWQPFVPDETLAPYFLPMLVWRFYRNLFPLPHKFTYAIVQLNEPLELVMAIGFWLFFRSRSREFRAPAPGRPVSGR